MVIPVGSAAPPVDGVAIDGPHALVFYKVTCSTTQLAAPPLSQLGDAYPGAVAGVGQDPSEDLAAFALSASPGQPPRDHRSRPFN